MSRRCKAALNGGSHRSTSDAPRKPIALGRANIEGISASKSVSVPRVRWLRAIRIVVNPPTCTMVIH